MYKQLTSILFEGVEVPVYVTDEYDRFKYDPANRPVRDKEGSINIHAAKIKSSIEKNKYLFSLVICNEKGDVIDGQHRVVALQELSLPVYFVKIKGYGGTQIQALNEYSSNWKKLDFAHYFAVKNIPDYKRFLMLYQELKGFAPGTLATLISSPLARKKEVFNSGTWQIKAHLKDTDIRKIIGQILNLADLEHKVLNRSCSEALWRIMMHKDYDQKRMFTSFENYAHKFFDSGKKESHYMYQFTAIYNHGRSKANAVIFYDADDLKKIADKN